MSDLIDRQTVLDAIDNERKSLLSLGMKDAEHIVVHHARRIIERLPSVIPAEKPTYRKKAKRWKRKYFALKTEIEKMKAEIQNMPKTYPHTDHFDDYVKTEDVLRIINKHIGKEQR